MNGETVVHGTHLQLLYPGGWVSIWRYDNDGQLLPAQRFFNNFAKAKTGSAAQVAVHYDQVDALIAQYLK